MKAELFKDMMSGFKEAMKYRRGQEVRVSRRGNRKEARMEEHTLSKIACMAFVFCVGTAVSSRAQTFTTLVSFNGTNGANPAAGLVQGTDANFYGTTAGGGANNNTTHCSLSGCGTVFKITPGGTLTTLYSFCAQTNCTDGATPSAGLVQATDGNFYGTTAGGGTGTDNNIILCSGCGTVFKITPGGALTTLYSFCSQINCTDGTQPHELVQATDGNFYGTTSVGGPLPSMYGTIFKITPSGTLTTLHSFVFAIDGANPTGLVQATDGNFYGTTQQGGASQNCNTSSTQGCGTAFKVANPRKRRAQLTSA